MNPTFQTGHFKGLRTTIYKVSDIDEAKEWYTIAFGMAPYFEEPFYVGFNISGYELGLQPENNPSSSKSASVISYWGTDNILESYDHMINSGASEHELPKSVGGEVMVASVKDPWNNIIGIIYNPIFKAE